MSRTLLYIECKANAKVDYFWDHTIRDVVATTEPEPESCEFWELPTGTLIDSWCQGTTRVDVYTVERAKVRREETVNSDKCALPPCGLRITDVQVTGQELTGANATATISTTIIFNVEYSLNNFVDVQDSPVFPSLGIGHYTAYARVRNQPFCVDSYPFRVLPVYKERYFLQFKTVQKQTCRVSIWDRDWSGPVTELRGAASPFQLEYPAKGDKKGGIQGSAATISFLLEEEGVMLDFYTADERKFRVDMQLNGVLTWRGYALPDILEEPWLAVEGRPQVTLRASDALGTLKQMPYCDDAGMRYYGRETMQNVLKRCVDKLDLDLPLHLAINLKETTQPEGEPLSQLYIDQAAYYDEKGKVDSCYKVVEKLLGPFFGVLVQGPGALHIVSLPELKGAYPARVYEKDGTLREEITAQDFHLVHRQGDVSWRMAQQTLTARQALRAAVVSVPFGPAENFVHNADFEEWGNAGLQNWTGPAAVERALNEKGDGFRVRFLDRNVSLAGANYIESTPYEATGVQGKIRVSFDYFFNYDQAEGDTRLYLEVKVGDHWIWSSIDAQHIFSPTSKWLQQYPPANKPPGPGMIKGTFEAITLSAPPAPGPVTVRLYEPVGPNPNAILEIDNLRVEEVPSSSFEVMFIEGENEIYSTAPLEELELHHGTGIGRFEALVTLPDNKAARLFGDGYLLQEWTLRQLLYQYHRPTLVFTGTVTGQVTPLTTFQDITLQGKRLLIDGVRWDVRANLSEIEAFEIFGHVDDTPEKAMLYEDGTPMLYEDGTIMLYE
jgi:hypothetical protein